MLMITGELTVTTVSWVFCPSERRGHMNECAMMWADYSWELGCNVAAPGLNTQEEQNTEEMDDSGEHL